MTPHTEAERAAFEAWARGYGTWEVKRDDDAALGTTGYTDITLTVAWHAVQAAHRAPETPTAENIRDGAPYDNPAFEQLARDMGVWGTPQAALCAQFWLAAERSPLDRQQIQSMIDQHVGLDSCDATLHGLARAIERAHGIQEQRHGQ